MKLSLKQRRALRIPAAVVAADVMLSFAWLAASQFAGSAPDDGEAIAILWGDGNQLGAEGRRRVAHALTLWRNGEPSRLIFCIGGLRPASRVHGAKLLCDQIAGEGVPPDRLRVGRGSYDTVSNIEEVAALARETGVTRVDLVTDPAQALRARLFIPIPAGAPRLQWMPYDYFSIIPRPGLLTLWWRVHHEWLGVASLLLPEGARKAILALIRT